MGVPKQKPLAALKPLRVLDSKPTRFYSTAELEAIYCVAPYNWHFWKFLANTGLRRQEFLQVRWEHLDGGTFRVISTEDSRTKSGKWREIPLSPGALMSLECFAKDRSGEFLAPRMNCDYLSRTFVRVHNRNEIKTPRASIHCLRHTFYSHLIDARQTVSLVQQLTGHTNHSTTERYVHLAPDHLRGSTSDLNL